MIAKLLLAKSGGGAGAQEEPGGVPNPRVDSVALAKKRLARQHAAEPGGQAREAHVEVDEEEDSAGPLEESASSDLKLPCKTDSILLARTRIDKKHQVRSAPLRPRRWRGCAPVCRVYGLHQSDLQLGF